MNAMQVGVLISAYDHASGIIGRIEGRFKRLTEGMKEAWAAGRKLEAIGTGMKLAGDGMLAAGAGAAAALNFKGVVQEAMDANHVLHQLANIADWTPEKIKTVQAEVLALTSQTNQSQAALLEGLTDLLAKGMDESKARALLVDIGKTATAATADVKDLSSTLFSAVDVAGASVGETRQLLDGLVTAGKEGAFELKAMARYMPSVLAATSALNMGGRLGVIQAAAWLQVARKGAGTEDEAATNLQNFLLKLNSPETDRNFARMGASLKDELAKAWDSGDLIGTMVRRTVEISKGDVAKLFQDQQVLKFLFAAQPNLDTAAGITARAMEGRGVVGKDYERIMRSFNEQLKQTRILIVEHLMPKVTPWLERLNQLLSWLGQHPQVLAAGINVVLGLLVGGGLLKIGGMAVGLLRVGSAAIQGGKDLAYCLRAGKGLSEGLSVFAGLKFPWITSLTSGVKAFGVATWGGVKAVWALGAAFLSTPVGWVVAAIAALIGIGVVLWKYWDRITAWFKRTFPGLHAAFADAWNGMKAAFAAFWAAVKPVLTAVWDAFKQAFAKLQEALKPLWSALQQLWERFKPFLGPVFKAIGTAILIPIALALGVVAAAVYALIKIVTWVVRGWTLLIQKGKELWAWLSGFGKTLFTGGVNLVKSIWEGIKSFASKPVEAIREIVGKIRKFLPFSPAKEGPLTDIHRIRLVETIAEGMKPGALTSRLTSILGSARALLGKGLTVGASVVATPAVALAGSGAKTIQITIHVDARGAGPGVGAEVEKAVLRAAPALKRELERLESSQGRRTF